MELLTITILPSFLILYFFVISDKYREPIPSLLKALLIGVIMCGPSYILTSYLLKYLVQSTAIDLNLVYSFLSSSFIEELMKFIGIFICLHIIKDFDEPVDGVVYGVCVSLGFATLENFYYIFYLEYKDLSSLIIRSLGAIPMHALTGAIIGMYMIKYFEKSREKFYLGLIFTYLLHSTYNFLVLSVSDFFALILIVIACYIFINKFVKFKSYQ